MPPPVGTFSQVGAGWLYACALRTDGRLACWGEDESGRASPPEGTFVQLSAGKEHGCALRTDHTVACWGFNYNAEATPPPGTFTQVSAGSYHSCALKSDGTIACWGQDTSGQSTPPAGVFTQVSAGGAFSCALRPVGTVLCWGARASEHAAPPGLSFTQVSAGANDACALATDGRVFCWSGLVDGEVWSPPGTFTQVSVGLDNVCALLPDGFVVCWGRNAFGEANAPWTRFTQVAAGFFHACAITPDQSLRCWGDMVVAPPNQPPVALPGGPYTVSEGEVLAFSPQGWDPEGDQLRYTLDMGDGTPAVGTPPGIVYHTYADDGVYTIRLTVDDLHGGVDTKTTTATVVNVAPSIPAAGGLSGPATPIQLAAGSASAPIRLIFLDPAGTHDTYSARIECGNGTVLEPTGITSPYTATCSYTAAGVYPVSATVSDEDGGTSTTALFQSVVVEAPIVAAGAFATGGGWFSSPPSACPSICRSTTAKGHFTFDVKFPPGGMTAPAGSAKFWLQNKRLDLRSTSIEMPTVAGQRVQFGGTGTVNGEPGYTFRITAVDGKGGAADVLRVEIWDPNRVRVYDNQWGAAPDAAPTTPVEGGQIVFHEQRGDEDH